MTVDLRSLSARIAALPRQGRGRRYPDDLRAEIVTAVTRARRAGMTVGQIETDLDVAWNTIARWRKLPPSAALVPVLVRETCRSSPVLVSPTGWRVEGLSFADLRSLLEVA